MPQTLLTLLLLAIYAVLSWWSSPFISPHADRMDQSARTTALLTVRATERLLHLSIPLSLSC